MSCEWFIWIIFEICEWSCDLFWINDSIILECEEMYDELIVQLEQLEGIQFNECLYQIVNIWSFYRNALLNLLLFRLQVEIVPQKGEFLIKWSHIIDILHISFVNLRNESLFLHFFIGVIKQIIGLFPCEDICLVEDLFVLKTCFYVLLLENVVSNLPCLLLFIIWLLLLLLFTRRGINFVYLKLLRFLISITIVICFISLGCFHLYIIIVFMWIKRNYCSRISLWQWDFLWLLRTCWFFYWVVHFLNPSFSI